MTSPGAGVGEQIASYALPVLAGAVASLHPAAARGLAGLTSAIDTQTQLRLIGQREQKERDFGMRLSDLLKSDTGVQVPDEASIEQVKNVMGTPEGPVPMPTTLTTRPQRLSEALGPMSSKLVQAYIDAGQSGQAGQLLATQAFQKPQYHVVKDWDPATNSYREKVVRSDQPGYVSQGKPEMTDEAFLAAMRGQRPPGQPSSPTPAGTSTGAPNAPTNVPPPATGGGFQAAPRVTGTISPSGKTIHFEPGKVDTDFQETRDASGKPIIMSRFRDQDGNVSAWKYEMDAKVGNERARLEAQAADVLKVPRDSPDFAEAVGLLSMLTGTDQQKATALAAIRNKYGRLGGQPSAPAPAGQPSGAVSPSPGGALPPAVAPTPLPGGTVKGPTTTPDPTDFQAIQAQGAQVQTQQEAARRQAEAAAGERGKYGVTQNEEQLNEKADRLVLPDGRRVPRNWTLSQANAAGATEISSAQQQALAGLGPAQGIVETIDQITQKLNTKTTFLDATRHGLALSTQAKAGVGPNAALAASYLAERAAFNGRLVKALGGDTGTLSNGDIQRMTNALPNLGDTKQVRDAKMSVMQSILKIATEAQQNAATGRESYAQAQARIQGQVAQLVQTMELKPPSMADIARAKRDAMNDPQKSLDLLRQRGFNPAYDVTDAPTAKRK